jgi:hypothetical protein
LNDLINIGKALAGATELLTGNGTRTHRRYGVPPVRTTYEKRSENSYVPLSNSLGCQQPAGAPAQVAQKYFATGVGNSGGPSGAYWFLRTMERSQWFEGEFTNFFKLGFDPSSYLDRLDQLVNFKFTPQTLWELSPWSWLVDWHLRIGDTIAANELAADDKLVMHYGYAMEKTVMTDVLSVRFNPGDSIVPTSGTTSYVYWSGLPDSVTYVVESTFKRRIRANPFGFRTGGTAALSEGQLSILGALGLTKLK